MHLIHRQIIELECASEQRALHWQRELAQVCENRLMHELEQTLNQFAGKNQVIQIEQLSLDLGALSGENFQNSFVSAVLKQLPKQLEERIKSLDINNVSEKYHNTFESFTYFLKNGTLPWWSHPIPLPQMAEEVLRQIDKTSRKSVIEQLQKALQSFKSRERLILQFGADFWKKLLQTVAPDRWNLVNSWSKILLQILSEETNIYNSLKKRLKNWITHIILRPEEPQVRTFFIEAVRELNIIPEFIYHVKRKQKSEILPSGLSFETLISELGGINEDVPKDNADMSDLDQDNDIEAITKEGFFVSNAGLVLLTPFLLEYFKACKIADDKELLNKELAVHYLQYLVTGEKITPEYDLILNKLICNLPLDAPVPMEIDFQEEALEQADLLLHSVIRYWDALKNTSIEGLRESFLQRQGKLSRRDDGWLLQIEQQSYDMLLEHLPWSYSIIKLPWMQEMLWVEWV
ncbi:MAG: hypothetical protein IPJ74_06050 [Saprospiraceae bacterium]|nr:hypothetical protein [Saprospiraceae bacterium]